MKEEKSKTVKTTTATNKTKKASTKAKVVSESKKPVKNVKNTKKTAKKSEKTTKRREILKYEPKNIKILGFNNLELNTYIYDNVTSPKAVVIIIHGMMEHCLRYKNFAEFLNKNNYIVVTSDLRGHGKTAVSREQFGYGEEDIFQESVKDQLNIIDFVSNNFDLPIYLFGHSYGSMLSQNLIQMTQKIEKCVLCGTANGNASIMKLGNFLVRIMSPFKDPDKKGGFAEKTVMKTFEKPFKNGNWYSRDEKVFEDLLKDELCARTFPFSFYDSLMRNMAKMNDGIDKIGNKKILFIVGSKDPVGQNSKQVKSLYKKYLNHNIDAKFKIYQDARHELLNEINKQDVYQDVLNFFEN